MPMMQESVPSMFRKPTERTSAERSAQRERTRAPHSSPGLMVTTRKIAALVRADETSCGRANAAEAPTARESCAMPDLVSLMFLLIWIICFADDISRTQILLKPTPLRYKSRRESLEQLDDGIA